MWQPAVESILKQRGDQPRQKQNRLIFLAADYDTVGRLKDQVKSVLAWQSIVTDYRENRLVLDNLMAKNADGALSQAKDALQRMVRETYKWLLVPVQTQRAGNGMSEIQWEHFPINSGSQGFTQEIERVLKENELLITEWAPVHLANMLRTWFWKDNIKDVGAQDVWEKSCCYLYLPRLKDEGVFRNTLTAGSNSRDFFGIAQGKNSDKYVGFSFGKTAIPILDAVLLLIEPGAAAEYEKGIVVLAPAEPLAGPLKPIATTLASGAGTVTATKKKYFHASINLDPILAKKQFADLVDEVILQFTQRTGTKVTISLEIQAESQAGFTSDVQRAVKENCKTLRFKNADFEEGESK